MKVAPPNSYGVGKLKNHPNWKGGVTRDKRGYIYVKSPDHPHANGRGYVFQHRLVMERKLKRLLLKNEVVHHINGIKDDNRPENLELHESQKQHIAQYHTSHLKPRPRDLKTGRFT